MKNKLQSLTSSAIKFGLIILLGLFSVAFKTAQQIEKSVNNELTDPVQTDKKNLSEPYNVVEKMPQYPGGEKQLLNFISQNLKYPVIAQENGIQGRVILRFVVSNIGKVSDVVVLRSLDPSCDKEAVRVIKLLADWIPGEQNGEKVSVYYTLPIFYKLSAGNTNPLVDANFRKTIVCLVDGVQQPIGFDFKSIKSENIASINVMKPDTEERKAALIAKYGEKASNGVLIIKTKQAIVTDSLKKDIAEERVFTVVQKRPYYTGGDEEMWNVIVHNLRYPVIAVEKGIQGKVIIRFVVLKTGKTSNIEVLKSLDPACDKEAIRVVKMLENWIPGEQNGEKVSVYYTLPILFKMQ